MPRYSDLKEYTPTISSRIHELARSKHVNMSLIREENNTRMAYLYSQKVAKVELDDDDDYSPLTTYPRLDHSMYSTNSSPKRSDSPPKHHLFPNQTPSPKSRHISPPKVFVRGKKKEQEAETIIDYQAEHDLPLHISNQKGKPPPLIAKPTRPMSSGSIAKRKDKKRPPVIVFDPPSDSVLQRNAAVPITEDELSKLEVIKMEELDHFGYDDKDPFTPRSQEQKRVHMLQTLEEERSLILTAVRTRMGNLSQHIFNQDGSFKLPDVDGDLNVQKERRNPSLSHR
jgi:hypothetical protein